MAPKLSQSHGIMLLLILLKGNSNWVRLWKFCRFDHSSLLMSMGLHIMMVLVIIFMINIHLLVLVLFAEVNRYINGREPTIKRWGHRARFGPVVCFIFCFFRGYLSPLCSLIIITWIFIGIQTHIQMMLQQSQLKLQQIKSI